jgi:hypothetical protein
MEMELGLVIQFHCGMTGNDISSIESSKVANPTSRYRIMLFIPIFLLFGLGKGHLNIVL